MSDVPAPGNTLWLSQPAPLLPRDAVLALPVPGAARCPGGMGARCLRTEDLSAGPHQLLTQSPSASSCICVSPSVTSTKWFITDVAQSHTAKVIWGLNGFHSRGGSAG